MVALGTLGHFADEPRAGGAAGVAAAAGAGGGQGPRDKDRGQQWDTE